MNKQIKSKQTNEWTDCRKRAGQPTNREQRLTKSQTDTDIDTDRHRHRHRRKRLMNRQTESKQTDAKTDGE